MDGVGAQRPAAWLRRRGGVLGQPERNRDRARVDRLLRLQVQEETRVVVGGGADGRGPLEREAGVDRHGEGDVGAARVLGGAVEQLDHVAEPEGEGRGPGRRGEGRGGDVLGAPERAQLEPGRRRDRDAALHVVGRAVALEAVGVDDDRVRPSRGDAAQGGRVRAVARRPGGHERGRVTRGDLRGRARALVGRGGRAVRRAARRASAAAERGTVLRTSGDLPCSPRCGDRAGSRCNGGFPNGAGPAIAGTCAYRHNHAKTRSSMLTAERRQTILERLEPTARSSPSELVSGSACPRTRSGATCEELDGAGAAAARPRRRAAAAALNPAASSSGEVEPGRQGRHRRGRGRARQARRRGPAERRDDRARVRPPPPATTARTVLTTGPDSRPRARQRTRALEVVVVGGRLRSADTHRWSGPRRSTRCARVPPTSACSASAACIRRPALTQLEREEALVERAMIASSARVATLAGADKLGFAGPWPVAGPTRSTCWSPTRGRDDAVRGARAGGDAGR